MSRFLAKCHVFEKYFLCRIYEMFSPIFCKFGSVIIIFVSSNLQYDPILFSPQIAAAQHYFTNYYSNTVLPTTKVEKPVIWF